MYIHVYTYVYRHTLAISVRFKKLYHLHFHSLHPSLSLSPSSPTLKGPPVTHLHARQIVLKLLSVTSSHRKMQKELAEVHAIGLLSSCLFDPCQEDRTNATIALANVAQNVDSHELVRDSSFH